MNITQSPSRYPRTFRTQSAVTALLLGVGATILTGCGGRAMPGTQPTKNNAPIVQASYSPSVEDWRSMGYSLNWVGYPFPAVADKNAVKFIDVGKNSIAVQEKGSVVTLLEAGNGQVRWTNQVATGLTNFVGLNLAEGLASNSGGSVLALSESEAFVLAASSGSMISRERLPRVATTSGVVMNGSVIFGSATGEVVSHKLGTGLKAWGFLAQGTMRTDPVAIGESACFVSQAGDVVFLDSFAGRLVGRNRVYGGLESKPFTDGNAVYIASTDQSVWAFGPTGQTMWRYRTPQRLTAQPVVIEGTLYIEVPGDGLTALDAETGSVRWNNTNVGGTVVGVRKSRVMVFENGTLTALEAKKGAVVSSIQTPGITRIIAEKPVDGDLYAVTETNLIVKFAAR